MIIGIEIDGAGADTAAWRGPEVDPRAILTGELAVRAVQRAEAAGVDLVTFVDALEAPEDVPGQVSVRLDALGLAARVAPVTHRIGLLPTITVTHTEPFHVQASVATLDHISAGRGGWVAEVSSSAEAAAVIGRREPAPAAETWREARYVVDVSRRLWDSWEDDAIIRDASTGRYIDRDKLHYVDFESQTFAVKGPSIVPRPPQGHPVTAVRVSSPEALEAAADAELVFLPASDDLAAQVRALRGEDWAAGTAPRGKAETSGSAVDGEDGTSGSAIGGAGVALGPGVGGADVALGPAVGGADVASGSGVHGEGRASGADVRDGSSSRSALLPGGSRPSSPAAHGEDGAAAAAVRGAVGASEVARGGASGVSGGGRRSVTLTAGDGGRSVTVSADEARRGEVAERGDEVRRGDAAGRGDEAERGDAAGRGGEARRGDAAVRGDAAGRGDAARFGDAAGRGDVAGRGPGSLGGPLVLVSVRVEPHREGVERVLEAIEGWIEAGVDGVHLRPGSLELDVPLIADELLPALRKRGLVGSPERAGSFRGRLGLRRARNRYAGSAR